jgi:hypothetical protein
MKKKPKADGNGAMRREYSFGGGLRGKYAARYAVGSNVVVLDPDVAAVFRSPEQVNRALRALLKTMPARRAGGTKGAK